MLRVAVAGGERVALIERRGTRELVRVLEGQSLMAGGSARIHAGGVALRAGEREVLLELERDKSSSTVPTPPRRLLGQEPLPGGVPAALEPNAQNGVLPLEDGTDFEPQAQLDGADSPGRRDGLV